AGMTIPTPRKERDLLYFTCFYSGSMMLKLAKDKPAASILWKGKRSSVPKSTDELHSTMSTPVLKDGHIYGVSSYGEFRCLKADTGEKLWQTFQPTTGKEVRWGNVFIVEQGDRYFLFNENGDLIIARLTPKGYEEIDRAHVIKPTNQMAGRPVVWVHTAFANEDVEHNHHQPGDERGQKRAAQRLVDAVVDHLRRQVRVLAADFADAVEDNDGVVDRVADQGEQRGHRRQVDLEVLQQQEAGQPGGPMVDVVGEGDDAHSEEQVVDEAQHGRQAERPVAEPEP